MARFFGSDIIYTLQTVLTAQLPAMITLLQTERADTGLEQIRKVNVGNLDRQFPECLISLGDSEVDVEHLSMDIQDTPETFDCDVVIITKDISSSKTYLRTENYVEALMRILHGYSDSNITWVVVVGGIRTNMYTESKEVLRVSGVKLSVRIL
jgi:hypothetical protein